MYQHPPPPYLYPGTPAPFGYYPPSGLRYGSATPSPRGCSQKSRHSRHTSQQIPASFAYSARGQSFIDPRHQHYYASTSRKPEFVSDFDYSGGQTRFRAPTTTYDRPQSSKQFREYTRHREYFHFGSHRHHSSYRVFDDDDYGGTPPPSYEKSTKFAPADHSRYHYQSRYHDQDESYDRDTTPTPKPNQSRRRASYMDPQPYDRPQTTPPRSKPPPVKREATAEDCLRYGIPAGYSTKNWDPTEEPIAILGSVFDANSLGKWIYDWASYAYGHDKPLTDMAAELWLLLIHLAGKSKRADDIISQVRVQSKREMVEDFLESGERLWIRFRKLLKICEDYMWKAAQQETGSKKPINMGAKSGVAFVKCLFGRDCELDKTEKLMANIRLFTLRFEANIEPIIRFPQAADSQLGKDNDSESES